MVFFFGTLNFLLFILDTPQTPWLQVETLRKYTMKSPYRSYRDTLLILKNHGLPQSLPELSPFLLIPGMMCIWYSMILRKKKNDIGYGLFLWILTKNKYVWFLGYGSIWQSQKFTLVENPLVLAHHPNCLRFGQPSSARDSQELVGCDHPQHLVVYPLVMTNIAIEHGHLVREVSH